jgi:gas vesicle protein
MTTLSFHKNSSSGVGTGLLYLLIGGGIGAAVALLFAPKPGAELRGDISDIAHKGYDETVELAHKLKEQSNELYQAVRERADHVYGFAASKFWHAAEALEATAETAKDNFGNVLQLDEKSTGKGPKGPNRQPARIL